MTLKHVVLPAPLGPISPRISPRLIEKWTSLSATTPPKRSVTWSISRSLSPSGPTWMASASWSEVSGAIATAPSASVTSWVFSSGIGGGLLGFDPSVLEFSCSPSARHQSLRAQDHHQDQGDAEGERTPLLELTEPLRQVGQQERAEEHTDDVARSADDDHGHEEERQVHHERVGLDVLLLAAEQQARDAADGRADGEGPQLELEARDAHHGGGVLVLADGQPGAAHPAVLEAARHEDHEDQDDEREPVPPLGVAGVEEGAAVDLRAGRHGDAGDAGGAVGDGVQVASGDPDDLAEAEGDDREVVT